jgi:cyanophycinase-like exopeptidase
MKLVIAGGVITKKNNGKDFLNELVRGFKEPVRILDVLFSVPEKTWGKTFEEDRIFYRERLNKNFILELAQPEKFAEQVKNSDAVMLRGGSTKKLLEALRQDLSWLKFLDGKTIGGTSAGADAISKYYYDIDNSSVEEGFGLAPLKVIVHFKSENYKIGWKKAAKQLESHKEKLPVHKLKEGEFIVVEADH